MTAASFLDRHGDTLTAAATFALTIAVAVVVHRALARRAQALALAVAGGELSREADTRLRFLRRAADAAIVVIGLALALAQFTDLDRVAGPVLASSAIVGVVVGFAARQTLANAIAGVMLAVTQPLRIGDLVTFEGETGTVEDVRLTYTWLRTGADARLIVPNERLAAGVLRNDSIRSPTVEVEASVWLATDADETRALAAVEALDVSARVAECTTEGIRLLAMGAPVPPTERLRREGELRAAMLRALREAGVR